jgi:hypothetical protein
MKRRAPLNQHANTHAYLRVCLRVCQPRRPRRSHARAMLSVEGAFQPFFSNAGRRRAWIALRVRLLGTRPSGGKSTNRASLMRLICQPPFFGCRSVLALESRPAMLSISLSAAASRVTALKASLAGVLFTRQPAPVLFLLSLAMGASLAFGWPGSSSNIEQCRARERLGRIADDVPQIIRFDHYERPVTVRMRAGIPLGCAPAAALVRASCSKQLENAQSSGRRCSWAKKHFQRVQR